MTVSAFDSPRPDGGLGDPSHALYRRVTWRLIPLLFVCFIVAYLDRVNVGFAKLQMQSALGLSDLVYGVGAGIFFIGYFLFEVPSNIAMHRVGARRWIARIMITWGALSAATMFVQSAWSFYAIRFLLGVAEAGFFPGIILYLTYWFPAQRRSKAISLFVTAIPVSGIIGGPFSGWILQNLNGAHGWAGWQWLFLLQGLPTVLVGFVVLRFLDDRVADATWLSPDERRAIEADIAAEAVHKQSNKIGHALMHRSVWLFAAIYFSLVSGLYGVSFWLPSIIKGIGVSRPLDVGLLSAVPWAFGVVAMMFVARSADKRAELRWHTAASAAVGVLGLIMSVIFHGNPPMAMVGLTLATMGIMASLPVFWGLPTALLGGAGAAAGIAFINSIGNLSGFVAPSMIGALKDATGTTDAGLYALAAILFVGCVLSLCTRSTRSTASA